MKLRYTKLWEYLKNNCISTERLSFEEIYAICGEHIDHSFMEERYCAERYGISVMKIDMRDRTVLFCRNA